MCAKGQPPHGADQVVVDAVPGFGRGEKAVDDDNARGQDGHAATRRGGQEELDGGVTRGEGRVCGRVVEGLEVGGDEGAAHQDRGQHGGGVGKPPPVLQQGGHEEEGGHAHEADGHGAEAAAVVDPVAAALQQ